MLSVELTNEVNIINVLSGRPNVFVPSKSLDGIWDDMHVKKKGYAT
jgi:hypothetical protein